ncbi:MAG TPA: tetratricopeptide repeat protein [Rectinemataceae bacterium]|nr:tetratricopeptide repeat protein [Rectinemataceae bacterium]
MTRKSIVVAAAFAVAFLAPTTVAAQSLQELKTGYESALAAAQAAPADYAANWQAAKAARQYGDRLKTDEVSGWKDQAKPVAKTGMKYGEIAFKLNSSGIEGWYWYGLCVGTYSDCVSIFSALAEGLKGKTQTGFENAYKFNKMYDNGGPIIALGRFWQSIPGIAGQDLKKSERLYDEYVGLFANSKDANSDAWLYRGELYRDTGRKDLARTDFQKAAGMGNKSAAKALAALK